MNTTSVRRPAAYVRKRGTTVSLSQKLNARFLHLQEQIISVLVV